jgi:hypothetical protein
VEIRIWPSSIEDFLIAYAQNADCTYPMKGGARGIKQARQDKLFPDVVTLV